jgi:hypothetical protein
MEPLSAFNLIMFYYHQFQAFLKSDWGEQTFDTFVAL